MAPSGLYAPTCVPVAIPTNMVAGTSYSFLIQSRDFFSNNMKLGLEAATKGEYEVIYTGPVQLYGIVKDDTD